MKRISVLGAGSWGCALATVLADNGYEVCVWSRNKDKAQKMNETRRLKTLPEVTFAQGIHFTSQLDEALAGDGSVVLAVPSIGTRGLARQISSSIAEGRILINVSKGIEESTGKLLTEQISEEVPQARVCVLSGPSHAEEVSRHMPTVCVVGSRDKQVAETVRDMFMNKFFRVYISSDVTGIEIGGALKNVIALAAGMADGLGYGDNAKAALITRGIAEMCRLGMKMGGNILTFAGLTGVGDLIVTCASMHSRNRRAGILIGQGMSMQAAMDEVQMVVEGVYSAKAAYALSQKYDVQMPIVAEVNQILFEGKEVKQAVVDLMARDKIQENPDDAWE